MCSRERRTTTSTEQDVVPPEQMSVSRMLDRLYDQSHFFRGQKVVLDKDVAVVYRVSIGHLRRVVKRNPLRFPSDFAFQLSQEESQTLPSPKSLPYVFTEEGVLMLSGVLTNPQAVQASIEIIRELFGFRSN